LRSESRVGDLVSIIGRDPSDFRVQPVYVLTPVFLVSLYCFWVYFMKSVKMFGHFSCSRELQLFFLFCFWERRRRLVTWLVFCSGVHCTKLVRSTWVHMRGIDLDLAVLRICLM
jgi:hypothetical protein